MPSKWPFERFSEDAKRTLVLAQEEAEIAQRGYIGTEHLLLGLLRLESGPARAALTSLGIDTNTVRRTIETRLAGAKHARIEQIIPTSRVQRVIEIAFEQSQRMGTKTVESGHILIGLAVEGEGIAVLVLEEMGAPAARVIDVSKRHLTPRRAGPMPDPPANILALREKLASIRFAMKHAVEAGDNEHALRLGAEEDRLQDELAKADWEWRKSL